MALFGAKRNVLQSVLQSEWKSDQERDQLLTELKTTLKPKDAAALLWHRDAAVRRVGTDTVLRKPDATAFAALADAVGTKPPQQRGHVAAIFERFPPDVAKKCLDALLVERTEPRRRLGWEITGWVAPELREAYAERALTDGTADVKLRVLQRVLKERGPAENLELLKRLVKDRDARVAAQALEAISHVKDGEVVELMGKFLAGEDATARDVATRYLQAAAKTDPKTMRKRMLELLSEGDDASRHATMQILMQTGTAQEVVGDILVFCRDLLGWVRARIIDTLRVFGDDVLRAAVAMLEHPDEDIRLTALSLAESFDDPRILGPTLKLLESDDWWLRINACETLGRLKDARAVPYLVKTLSDNDARWAAIDALANLGSEEALRPLSQLLRDKRQEVRLEVVQAFSRYTDQRLLPLLDQVQKTDPASEVRVRASEVARDMSERLNVASTGTEAGSASVGSDKIQKPLDKLLAKIREMGASDLHITVDEPPFIRLNGNLQRLEGVAPVPPQRTEELVRSVLSPYRAKQFDAAGEVDFCHAIPEVGRYRANAFRQRRGICASFRVIPNVPPTFADIRLPGRLTELLDFHQGIIVVSGPAGCGKSTTLAALVNLINETRSTHVITLEDPVEFVHPVKMALVNQREVGTHTESFSRALRGALREDPDVIMVGEMRDTETIRLALTAAETGHLVIATLNTPGARQTVDRLVESFPPEEQPTVRMALSESLKYVVCQSLVNRKDGNGRVAAFEILKGIANVGSLIRDNKTLQLASVMQISRTHGMQTVDQALMDLVEADLITPETAWRRAEKPADFEQLCDPSFIQEIREGGAS